MCVGCITATLGTIDGASRGLVRRLGWGWWGARGARHNSKDVACLRQKLLPVLLLFPFLEPFFIDLKSVPNLLEIHL